MRRTSNGRCGHPGGAAGRFLRACEGVAAVEFALVAPILAMLAFGVIELSRYLYEQQTLDEAARVTARWVTVHGSKSDAPATATTAMTKAKEVAGDYSGLAGTVTFTPDNSPGSTVTVDLTRNHKLMLPFVSSGTLKLQAKTTQMIQH